MVMVTKPELIAMIDTSEALCKIESKISHGKTYNIGNMNEKYNLTSAAQLVIETLAPTKNQT